MFFFSELIRAADSLPRRASSPRSDSRADSLVILVAHRDMTSWARANSAGGTTGGNGLSTRTHWSGGVHGLGRVEPLGPLVVDQPPRVLLVVEHLRHHVGVPGPAAL